MFRNRTVVLSTAIAAMFAGVLTVSVARSDDKPKAADAAAGQMSKEQVAMMDAYMKLAQTGPEHQRLADMTGEWSAETKSWLPDGTDCGTGAGTMKCQMVLGGRYMQMNFDGEMNGPGGKMPFKGMGFVGYDNAKKKYVNLWMDDMSTGPMITEGTAEGNVITCTGESIDPVTGKPAPVKDVATHIDATHHKYELFMTAPDGKMYRCLEIMYTKK